jgi:DNA helicase-2/ATP-dependent DNA helicase PcrA
LSTRPGERARGDGLTAKDLRIIREETDLLDRVVAGIREAARDGVPADGRKREELIQLRDRAIQARTDELPSLLGELHNAQSIEGRARLDPLPDERAPYFAHLRTREGERERDFLLGRVTFLHAPTQVKVLDWRHAPLSRIFYQYREGDEYVEQLPGRLAEGTVEVRRVVTILDGKLMRIVTPERTLARDGDGTWTAFDRGEGPVLGGGEGSAERGRRLGTGAGGAIVPDVTALLDAEQFDILAEGGEGPMLILGGAGSGKTTIAMHRVATLAYAHPDRYAPEKVAAIVPEPGLARLIVRLLAALRAQDATVVTFAAWVRDQAARLVRGLPGTIYPDASPGVSKVKRHPALWSMLPEWDRRQAIALAGRLADLLPEADATSLQPDGRTRLQILSDAQAMGAKLARTDRPLHQRLTRTIARERAALAAPIDDLRELLADRGFLAEVARRSGGEIDEGLIEQTVRHAMDQAAETAETRYADVDEDRLQTLDGETLDAGTPDEAAGTRDPEDDALLLEMVRLATGRLDSGKARLPSYAHLVLDEAQELAPIELSLLGRTLGERRSLTVAGDSVQQVNQGSAFTTWEALLAQLGATGARECTLRVNYRSSRAIAEFAHRLLGPLAPAQPPAALRTGVPVGRFAFPTEGPASVFLIEALSDLMAREPGASVAVICRHMESAAPIADLLAQVPRARLVRDGDFPFTPGIDVTDVSQIKGLEFDYVIIPDADATHYPLMPESRRLLHVAATRAIHQLWVISVGHPSPVLPL